MFLNWIKSCVEKYGICGTAEKCGVHESRISRWVNRLEAPSFDALCKIKQRWPELDMNLLFSSDHKSGFEREGFNVELEDQTDYVLGRLTRGQESYEIRFYMPFAAASAFVEQKKTSRKLILTPTTLGANIFIGELRKKECEALGRKWFSNGKHWFDATTGVKIAPFHPTDPPVAEKLYRFNAIQPIPKALSDFFSKALASASAAHA